MSRDRLLLILAALVLAIFALHIIALFLHLYWVLWWYDIIVHFLGGAFTGLLIVWLRYFSGYFGVPRIAASEKELMYLILVGTLGVGVGGEVFERAFGHTWSLEGYWLDTAVDLIMDIAGGITAFHFFKNRSVAHEQDA